MIKKSVILERLIENNFEAYFVGGCLRDSIMGRYSYDVDIATSATPAEIKSIFCHTVDTGIKHGTVTVLEKDEKAEVTTFRTEQGYQDMRHPDDVTFVSDIYTDLKRRDFTINAMAYNDRSGIIDPFGGQKDIKNKIIRCVGDPLERFGEDALRILRCIRFAATFDFDIEEKTQNAALKMRGQLDKISRERVLLEINKTLSVASYKHLKMLLRIADSVFKNIAKDEWIEKAAACKFIESKWAHLCKDKTNDVLAELKSSSSLRKTASELVFYENNEEEPLYLFYKFKYITPQLFSDYKRDNRFFDKYVLAKKEGRVIYPSQLAVNGTHLEKLGLKGKELAKIKEELFLHVLKFPESNNIESLLNIAERRLKNDNKTT